MSLFAFPSFLPGSSLWEPLVGVGWSQASTAPLVSPLPVPVFNSRSSSNPTELPADRCDVL